jgi:hypothetical protein
VRPVYSRRLKTVIFLRPRAPAAQQPVWYLYSYARPPFLVYLFYPGCFAHDARVLPGADGAGVAGPLRPRPQRRAVGSGGGGAHAPGSSIPQERAGTGPAPRRAAVGPAGSGHGRLHGGAGRRAGGRAHCPAAAALRHPQEHRHRPGLRQVRGLGRTAAERLLQPRPEPGQAPQGVRVPEPGQGPGALGPRSSARAQPRGRPLVQLLGPARKGVPGAEAPHA